ncbi:MAG TPA: glycosyltransferase family 4 protein [Gaiellaceae bacterium]|nr:glycosyltransferase family 4 protein [Gaiellaceae bacterium]
MKVLISAYACEPGAGSEPGVGWNWSVQAALRGHDVTTVTRTNNRAAIEAALAASPIPNLEFRYVDLPTPLMRLKKRLGFLGLYAYYYLWQFRVALVARRLHRERRFDLVHHVTFVNDWMPSGLVAARAPFVWGPVGGSTHVMPSYAVRRLPARFRVYERIRRLIQGLFHRFDPLVELTRRRASLILTYTGEALEGVPERHRRKARPIVHIGAHESDVPREIAPPPREPFTVLTGGRLVHWKGFDLVVEGFAKAFAREEARPRLVFTGDGSFRPVLEKLVHELGIADSVRFLGVLPTRDDVYDVVLDSHLYALPTWRDGPPVAILEAMLAARPVLCLDVGATRELVPRGAGFRIPAVSREQIVDDIAATLAWSRAHPRELRRMGMTARAHVLQVHDWGRIGEEIDSIYRALIAADVRCRARVAPRS